MPGIGAKGHEVQVVAARSERRHVLKISIEGGHNFLSMQTGFCALFTYTYA